MPAALRAWCSARCCPLCLGHLLGCPSKKAEDGCRHLLLLGGNDRPEQGECILLMRLGLVITGGGARSGYEPLIHPSCSVHGRDALGWRCRSLSASLALVEVILGINPSSWFTQAPSGVSGENWHKSGISRKTPQSDPTPSQGVSRWLRQFQLEGEQKHIPRACAEPDNASSLLTPKRRAPSWLPPSPSPTTVSLRPRQGVRAC